MLHRARSPETRSPAAEDADPCSPIPDELLEGVARVEDRLHSVCPEEQEEIAPKLAHLRSAIGEMTQLYENRLAEVRARNQQALDELQKLAGRVARRDSRIASQPEYQPSEQNSAPETPETNRPKEVPQRTPEPVRKAPKEKEPPPEKENPPKETKSKTRRSRKKRAAGPPGLPIGVGALPTAQPGWLAQAVGAEALGGGADPTAVAEAMLPWLRAAQALVANPLDAEVRFEETAPPQEPATAGPSPTRPSFGKQPATPGAYTPFVPGLLATPSPSWEPPDRASFGGLLKRPALQLSLNNMIPEAMAGTA